MIFRHIFRLNTYYDIASQFAYFFVFRCYTLTTIVVMDLGDLERTFRPYDEKEDDGESFEKQFTQLIFLRQIRSFIWHRYNEDYVLKPVYCS